MTAKDDSAAADRLAAAPMSEPIRELNVASATSQGVPLRSIQTDSFAELLAQPGHLADCLHVPN